MFEHLLEDNQLRPVLMEMADISEKDILFIKELIVGVIDKDTGMQAETFPFESAFIHVYTLTLIATTCQR